MSAADARPIVLFVNDLYFSSRIESNAAALNLPCVLFDSGVLGSGADGEAMAPGQMLSWLWDQDPAILIFDLDERQIPWEPWISLIRQSRDPDQLPIIAFGSHKDVERLKRARNAGANYALAKSRFVEKMTDFLSLGLQPGEKS